MRLAGWIGIALALAAAGAARAADPPAPRTLEECYLNVAMQKSTADLAYAARKRFPAPTRIFLLGEIIHNPEVNDQIREMGIVSLKPKPSDEDLAKLNLTPTFELPLRPDAEALPDTGPPNTGSCSCCRPSPWTG